ncbi:Multidrug resistance protein [Vermiconidia calcicola]|uniref:Multidrug resistance protein n=1 Tax=Vermiconidia calcicola TaxID=1690605 RepID=A0ACC3N2R0_9PEZI|nr:Multidrug resistance protein [Vermiconidia calcicola]
MSYYGDDDYDYARRRRPSPHRYRSDRRSAQFLNPDPYGSGLHRTRSQGHAPVPVVNVYNDILQDGSFRNSSRSPPTMPAPYPPSPEFRGRRDRLGDELVEGFADLAVENQRLRSRSRGRSDAGVGDRRDDYVMWELRQKERELRDIERRASLEKEEEMIKQKFELQRAQEEAKKKFDEVAKRAERRRIIADYEQQQREDEEDRIEEEKRLLAKIEREKREKEEKEKREYNEFLVKQKEKEEKDKREKKEAEEKLEEELRKRLSRNGYTYEQIERMISDEKDKVKPPTTNKTTTTTTTIRALGPARPTYAKVRREYLSIDTLTYYNIPYEIDRDDPDFIIILREMDKYETDVLFEHTRRLRAGGSKLLLEPAGKQPNYAWYRKRDRSTSRVRKLGILEVRK